MQSCTYTHLDYSPLGKQFNGLEKQVQKSEVYIMHNSEERERILLLYVKGRAITLTKQNQKKTKRSNSTASVKHMRHISLYVSCRVTVRHHNWWNKEPRRMSYLKIKKQNKTNCFIVPEIFESLPLP